MSGLVWLLGATPSLAANVVQVRVGNHPTFTRVVFQLDAPAGYRVEKAADQSEMSEPQFPRLKKLRRAGR